MMLPKDTAYRNSKLLELARGQNCMLRLTAGPHDPATVVSAHSNQSIHGKGKGRKAHDCFAVFSCATCHSELDQGRIYSREQKVAAFNTALMRTRIEMVTLGLIEAFALTAKDIVSISDEKWLDAWRNGEIWVR